MVLGTGTATDDGKTLRSNEELFPVLGRFAHAFISSGLGLDAAGFANNAFGLLASTTEDGELRMLGTPGYMEAEFDAEVVVRRHFAPRAASLLLAPWVHADDLAEAGRRETESASVTHMDTDFVLLSHAQNDDAGNPYVEPFWLFGLHLRTPVLLAMLATLLIATVFVRNLYCRFLCPLGAFLGILSKLTVFRIKRWSECKTCRICEKACEWGAIKGPQIIMTECVRCDDCERLYADQAVCPHWRIIEYNERKLRVFPLQPVR